MLSDNISVGIDVDFPVFVDFGPVGVGGRIGYVDENLLDNVTSNVTFEVSATIDYSFLEDAISKLAEITEEISEAEVLNSDIPLIGTSFNELVAGDGSTISELFNLTDFLKVEIKDDGIYDIDS